MNHLHHRGKLFNSIQGHFWRGGNAIQLIFQLLLSLSHLSGTLSSSPSTWCRAPRSGSPPLFWDFFEKLDFVVASSSSSSSEKWILSLGCQLVAAALKTERDLDKNPSILTQGGDKDIGVLLIWLPMYNSGASLCELCLFGNDLKLQTQTPRWIKSNCIWKSNQKPRKDKIRRK